MSDNIRFIIENLHNIATLTATTTAANSYVDNTKDAYRSNVWRSTAITAQDIAGDLDTNYNMTSMVINRHNLSPAATVQLVLRDGGAAGTIVYDSTAISIGTLIPMGTFVWGVDTWGGVYDEAGNVAAYAFEFASVSADYYTLTLVDSGSADGYIEVGQLILGVSWQPQYNFDNGIVLDYRDGVDMTRTDAGSLRAEGLAETYRVCSLTLGWLTDADRTSLISQMRTLGRGVDLWVSAYPTEGGQREREYAMVCKRTSNLKIDHINKTRWRVRMVLEES